MDYIWFMKFWKYYVLMFKSWGFLVIKKCFYLYQKINKFKTSWVPMDTWIPTSTRIVGTHEVRLTLHSAGVVDQIKYSVHNYSTKLTLQLLSCWKPLLFQCTFSLLNCCLRCNLLCISLYKKNPWRFHLLLVISRFEHFIF
jgi:hypothetical protein